MSVTSESRTVDILGLPIQPYVLPTLLDYFTEAASGNVVDRGEPKTVAYANAHSCNLAAADPDYLHAMQSVDSIYLDGNGPRIAAWMSGMSLPPRLTAPDWIDLLCWRCSQEGISFYFLGGRTGVAQNAADHLRSRYPDLEVVGAEDGYFETHESEAVVERINRSRPDILLLGMGSPKQELWMVEHLEALEVPLIWAAGGLLDYLSGQLPRAPYWTRALGIEWFGRLLIEPRRLAPRYLIGIPLFLLRSTSYAMRLRLGRARLQADG